MVKVQAKGTRKGYGVKLEPLEHGWTRVGLTGPNGELYAYQDVDQEAALVLGEELLVRAKLPKDDTL